VALGAGASATPASAQDLIEYALMAGVAADAGAPPGPDGAVSGAAGKTVELTDFVIDGTFIDHHGESMLLGAGIESRASYDRGDARVSITPCPPSMAPRSASGSATPESGTSRRASTSLAIRPSSAPASTSGWTTRRSS
jgi:hypothetical protein